MCSRRAAGREALQLASLPKIERALALFMVVSWQIARLMLLDRTCPDSPASLMFDSHEIKAAYVLTNKPSPLAPPSLNELVRRVAMLGGFPARKSDGEPGVKTNWNGLQRVMDFAAGVRFIHDSGDGASCVQWHGPDDTPRPPQACRTQPHQPAPESHSICRKNAAIVEGFAERNKAQTGSRPRSAQSQDRLTVQKRRQQGRPESWA